MFVAPTSVVVATTSDDLEDSRRRAHSWRSNELAVTAPELSDAALADLIQTSRRLGDHSFARTADAVLAARQGMFAPVPHIDSAAEILRAFLQHDLIDGWLYVRESDGHLHPYLVTAISMEHADRTRGPRIKVTAEADNPTVKRPSRAPRILYFDETEVVGKTPADIITAAGAYKETPELKAAYRDTRDAFDTLINTGFGEQYTFTGRALRTDDYRSPNVRSGRKVIHDVAPDEISPLRSVTRSALHGPDEYGPVPVITAVRVFDLAAQDFLDVNTADLTAYRYDTGLRAKLILPAEHRELLDILTTDISVFTGDIIDGKSAGNIVLAKGRPGVGKTLTAEVYSEVIGRPLYSIHSGSLGITPEAVRKNLEVIFDRADRWQAVLLLDEADVFVAERGFDLVQNAIVAEFLRTLEYFDGLLFLTTNRVDSVDEAILARCAAVLDYAAPTSDDARLIWQTLAAGHDVVLAEDLLDDLVAGFRGITPRDIKMLLRLALRMAEHHGRPLTPEIFARSAAFRNLRYAPPDQPSEPSPPHPSTSL